MLSASNIIRNTAARARLLIGLMWNLRTETAVALLNLATVAMSFLLQVVVLRMASGPRDADAYFATSAIPQVALSIAVHVVTGALMPQLARLDAATRSATVWSMLALILGGGLPIAALLWLTASFWTFAIFPGFANGSVPSSIQLAALAALAMPIAVSTSVLSGYMYAQRRFLVNETISLTTATGLAVAAAVVIPRLGIVALGWLVIARFAVQFLLLCTFLPFRGAQVTWSALTPVLNKARALLAGALYFKSDLLVDRYLLSLAPAGALSTVVFGQTIFAAASGVLGQSLANTASPTLSVAHHKRDEPAFRAALRRNLLLLTAASVLLLVIGIAIVPSVATLLTTRPANRANVDLQWVLLLFGGVPIGACLGSLLANAFYAMGDTRTPTIMTTSTFTFFLIAKVLVFTYVGVYAFCALTSIYYLGNTALLAWLLNRKMRREFAS